jgi:gamma-glutamylcyclotransferase (GGCT)/AIG2-like uncharacterized protein YtfP
MLWVPEKREGRMTRLFVYGTLMTGQRRNFYLTREGAECLGKVCTENRYSLFRPFLADYPGLVADEKRGLAVEGELWDVPEKCLEETIDFVEGVPRLFQRRVINMEDGQQAQAYLMPSKPWFAWRLGNRWK